MLTDRQRPITRAITASLLGVALAACAQQQPAEPGRESPSTTDAATASARATREPSPSPSAERELEAGWQVHQTADFSLALPENWQPIDAETLAEGDIFDELIEENPDLAAVLEQAESQIASGQVDFMAIELGAAAADGFAENVNVSASPFRGSLSDLEEVAVEEIQGVIPGARNVESGMEELPGGDAVLLRYEYPLEGPGGGEIDVAVMQYMIAPDDAVYIITFSTTADEIDEYEVTFEAIAETFAFDE